ncbi:chemotaxis protein CheA [Uliginosibacterium sediminicola]|uniref:Chemotaxis protein CheA n=1 Tax=Uliginosibacterium sediminicola TaxID=2024550 RepID=A0ABU9Z1X6_9RHOO
MDLSAARNALVEEARELLDAMEAALLEIEASGQDPERVNAIFRAAHTIKGSAGLFGLDLIVGFTHVMESVLDQVRSDELVLDASLVSTLLRCGDYLARLVDSIESGADGVDPDAAERASLLAVLEALLAKPAAAATKAIVSQPDDVKLEREESGDQLSNEHWHLSLRFAPEVLQHGLDPMSFINYLGGLGELIYVYTLHEQIPPADEMDPEHCYLGFEIDLQADVTKQQLEDVFEFVREDSSIRILPPNAKIQEYIALISSMPESSQRLGEILVAGGTLTQRELEQALALQEQTATPDTPPARLGELLIQEQMVQAPVVAAALSKQKQSEERRSQEQRVIKVDASKLDQLITLVGELVIASAGATITARGLRQAVMIEAINEVGTLVEQIRDCALDLRMIPIGEVFQRFPRVVRDVSKELGKRIDLEITGADTELDKSMVEKLGDPLLHIVRNAIDHGIESIEQREAAGKPAQGHIRLHAYHESGNVIIEVSDDGKGLDAKRIRAKAIERGMITPDAVLSDAEVHQLIFAAGFSTAEQVTNLSGRGVGMDVVKRSIEQLRGEIELHSTLGAGTCLRIRLPLTLAIIDGFQVGVGNSTFVIPLDMIEECVEFSSVDGHDYTDLRGQVLPFIRLRQLFDLPDPKVKRENIVVVKHSGKKFGLVVDKLMGEAQTVIRPLSKMFSQVKGISGSSILGSGEVALILDVPSLMQQASLSLSALTERTQNS